MATSTSCDNINLTPVKRDSSIKCGRNFHQQESPKSSLLFAAQSRTHWQRKYQFKSLNNHLATITKHENSTQKVPEINPFTDYGMDISSSVIESPIICEKEITENILKTPEFQWTIDDISTLNPAPIETPPSASTFSESLDENIKSRTHEAIKSFFQSSPIGVHSPHGCEPRPIVYFTPDADNNGNKQKLILYNSGLITPENKQYSNESTPYKRDNSRNMSVEDQNLSWNTYDKGQENDSMNTSTHRRKLLFQNFMDEPISPVKFNCKNVDDSPKHTNDGIIRDYSPMKDENLPENLDISPIKKLSPVKVQTNKINMTSFNTSDPISSENFQILSSTSNYPTRQSTSVYNGEGILYNCTIKNKYDTEHTTGYDTMETSSINF